ncbi:MAG: hypothetical protein J6K38_07020 [Alistipes sp.]|nr:hypothetical protein [Alistipes sp.]MBP3456002.1 hypothetical protein [Alistipes sp.]
MKNITLFCSIVLLSLMSVRMAAAQPPKGAFSFSAETRYAAPLGAGDEFSSIDIDAVFGYHFNGRWSIFVPVTGATGLFDVSGVRSYETTVLAGVGFEYNIISNPRYTLGLSPRVQAAVCGDWKHLSYDVGLRWRWASSPYVGLGVRYIDNYDSPFKNRCCLYVAFGFTLF